MNRLAEQSDAQWLQSMTLYAIFGVVLAILSIYGMLISRKTGNSIKPMLMVVVMSALFVALVISIVATSK